MPLERLLNLVPAPSNVVLPRFSWNEVERSLGVTKLPPDYKKFVEVYGVGTLGKVIGVWVPGAGSRGNDLLKMVPLALQTHRAVQPNRKGRGKELPWVPVFPEPDGIFPYARSILGDEFSWRTRGDAAKWTVHIEESRGTASQDFPMTFTELLVEILEGRIQSEFFEHRWERVFEPATLE